MIKKINNLFGKEIIFFDGAMGTLLQELGLKPGELPETWNITHSDIISKIHYEYLCAGANILKTNTFGAYETKFPNNLNEIINASINNAKNAIAKIKNENNKYKDNLFLIAYDVGPCGKLLEPLGDLSFDNAVELFKKSILIALNEGVDLILIETMNDIYEAKAAIIAAKEAMEICKKSIPIFATTVFDESGNLLTGSTPEIVGSILESLQIDAFGINCSLGPEQMKPLIPRLVSSSKLPVIVNPNAGLPRSENGKTIYDVSAEQFAKIVASFVDDGATVVGGCCGTTPKHIELLVKECKNKKCISSEEKILKQINESTICSSSHLVQFSDKPILIGERINPTGKKLFKQALRDNNISYIINEGLRQEEAGCHVLDVNVGLPEIDETKTMCTVLKELQSVTNLPLQIDTTNVETMEKALRLYNGKPLINSVNGKQEIMDTFFPLVKKYGGMVVALTLDEKGIPTTAQERVAIAKKIINEAKKYGIEKKDIIIDPLAMAISTDTSSGKTTLESIKIITEELKCKTSLGVSNISFGLPRRELINSTFFTMAMQNGLSAAIMNPLSHDMMNSYRCFCTLSNYDEQCIEYIEYATKLTENIVVAQTNSVNNSSHQEEQLKPSSPETLQYAVLRGLKKEARDITINLLQTVEPLQIIDNELIPALDIAGKDFENKKIYLPQLLMCAEAAKFSFNEIREHMIKKGKKEKSKGKIILATVKGDIHDIGKNIVKVLLENYSYEVIDLGKDVPPEKIVKACNAENVTMVGLSALMTTTVPSMEKTIKQLRNKCPQCKICVGGAVLTQEYADMIGADFYGKDAMDTVRFAQKHFA